MQQPLQITIKDIDHSEAVEEHIREKAEKLKQFSDIIISCQIVVELTQKQQQTGNLHNVHIRLCVPGKELMAKRNGDVNLYKAIRDAFDDMRDQLMSYTEQAQGKVKRRPDLQHGQIVRLFDDYGFIEGPDGTEFYFHANNVASHKFQNLIIGMDVHFIESMGEGGPQARRITVKSHE